MATQVADQTSILGLENPMGTDGFEFVEYTAPDIELLRSLFTKMGFPEVARHKSKNVTLHKQADCNFIINAEPGSYAEEYAKAHGPSACAMAFRVKDAKARTSAPSSSARPTSKYEVGDGELDIPAIEGIGGSRLYLRRSLRRPMARSTTSISTSIPTGSSGWRTRIRSSPTSTT